MEESCLHHQVSQLMNTIKIQEKRNIFFAEETVCGGNDGALRKKCGESRQDRKDIVGRRG